MRKLKCGRCGITFVPQKRFPKGKLRYDKDKMQLCGDCYISYLWWSASAETEKLESRRIERELLTSVFGEDSSDFDIPAEITDLKYSYLGVEK